MNLSALLSITNGVDVSKMSSKAAFLSAYASDTSANLRPGMGMWGLGAVLIAYAGAPAPGREGKIRKRTRTN